MELSDEKAWRQAAEMALHAHSERVARDPEYKWFMDYRPIWPCYTRGRFTYEFCICSDAEWSLVVYEEREGWPTKRYCGGGGYATVKAAVEEFKYKMKIGYFR